MWDEWDGRWVARRADLDCLRVGEKGFLMVVALVDVSAALKAAWKVESSVDWKAAWMVELRAVSRVVWMAESWAWRMVVQKAVWSVER